MIPGMPPSEEIKDPATRRFCEGIAEIMLIILARGGKPEDWHVTRGDLDAIKVARMGGLDDKVLYNPNAVQSDPVANKMKLPLVNLFDNSGQLVTDNDGVTVQYQV